MSTTQRTRTAAYPLLCYDEAGTAIDWLIRAFGFTELMRVPTPDGGIGHAELRTGDGIVMLGSFSDERYAVRSPKELRGVSGGVYVVVEDIDAHCERARAAGAEIVVEPHDTGYGSRDYAARDPQGHLWCFGTYGPEMV